MKSGLEWIVVTQQIVGSLDEFDTVYSWDGELFDDHDKALAHGLVLTGSDDFNIAGVAGDMLAWFGWDTQPLPDHIPHAAPQLGFRVSLGVGGVHIGRSFSDTRLEDVCPCPKEPCGLVAAAGFDLRCDQHPWWMAKTIRQSHSADRCPGSSRNTGDPA